MRRWVELVLRQYLAPLPPFGPDGQGWPLGRRVHGPELEAAVLQVEGVEYIEGLKVADARGTEPVPGTVELAALGGAGARRAHRRGGRRAGARRRWRRRRHPRPAPVPVPVPRDEC